MVKKLLKDDDRNVRAAAVNAFAELGSREDLPLVKELLNDNDRNVRAAAVNAFAELGSREDLPFVKEILKDVYWDVRAAAVNAFAKLGSEKDLDTLAALSAETCTVIEEPMKALGALDRKLYSPYSLSEEHEE